MVEFLDVPNAFTEGETIEEAYEMAFDVLGIMLQNDKGTFDYPKYTTDPHTIELTKDQFIAIVAFDEMEYLKKHGNKAVNKTITLPQWLNTMAQTAGINFSQTLQRALKAELGIE